ncbi:MAG: hypothetical protein ACE5R4_15330 [Armatimonadota bacterium]
MRPQHQVRAMLAALLLAGIGCQGTSLAARDQTPDIVGFRFVPHVMRHDRTEPVVFEARVRGNPTRVVLECDGTELQMSDDGTGGDRVADDNVHAIALQARRITSKLGPDDVFRPFVGYCKLYDGANEALRINVFAEVFTGAIPLVSVERIGRHAQASAHLVNLVGKVRPERFRARSWAQKFYRICRDDYDFLNFMPLPAVRGNRYHFQVKNAAKGLGMRRFDNTREYGSDGRLLGITLFPISYFFDGASKAYQHELAHQWINFLHDTAFESGIPHWPLSDVACGMIGFSIGGGGGEGGDFPFQLVPEGDNFRLASISREEMSVFNDLELYLMGLLPADQVEPHFVFDNQDQTPLPNALFSGPVTRVTIEDIVARVGPRDPDVQLSQKRFRVATIVVSDQLLTTEEMSFYDFFSRRAELRERVPYRSGFAKGIANPFRLSTGGRGELDTRIGETRRPSP